MHHFPPTTASYLLLLLACCPSSSIPECLLLYVSSRRFHLLLAPAESKRFATEARRATPTAGTCCTDHFEPQLKRNEKQSHHFRAFLTGGAFCIIISLGLQQLALQKSVHTSILKKRQVVRYCVTRLRQ